MTITQRPQLHEKYAALRVTEILSL